MADDLNQIKELKKTVEEIEGIFNTLSNTMSNFTKMQKISNQIGLITLSLNQDLDDVQKAKVDSISKELDSLTKVNEKKLQANKVSKDSVELTKAQSEELAKREKMEADLLNFSKQQVDLNRQNLRSRETLTELTNQSKIAQVGISKEAQKMLNISTSLETAQLNQTNLLIKQQDASSNLSEAGVLQSKLYTDIIKLGNSHLSTLVDQANTLDQVKLSEIKIVDVSREKNQLHQIEKEYLANRESLTKTQQKDIEHVISLKKQELANQEAYNAKLESMQSTMDGVSAKFDSGIQTMSGAISKMPGGDFLKKHLKLDSIASDIKENIMGSMTNAFTSAGGGAKGMFSALMSGVKSFGIALVTGPQAILFGTLALVGGLAALFMDLDKDVKEYADKMEVSRTEATKMQDSIGTMARDIGQVGVNTAEVAKTMFELRDAMGGLRLDPSVNEEHKQLIETTTLLNEKYGTTTEEAMNLKGIATNLGTTQEELAATMAVFGDKTIGAKKAMQALAKVPKTIASNFKGTTAELAKAVVKAEMLGMTLGDIEKIGDSMLDIESSLQAEMEARVMTGKNLNLDKIRELSLAGDIAGMQDEIVAQAGTLDEFNEMDKLGKEAIAKAMGMSVEQMTDMLTKQKENAELGWDAQKAAEMEAASAEDLNKMLNEEGKITNEKARAKLQQLAAEKESAGLQDRFSDALTKIKETMFKLVTPLMEIVNSLFASGDATEQVSGSLNGIGDVLGVIGSLIGFIFKGLMFVFGIAWDILKIALTPIFALFGAIKTAIDPLISAFSGLFDMLSDSGEKSVGIFDSIIGVIDPIFGIIMKAFVTPFKFVVGIISSIVKMFTGDLKGGISDIGSTITTYIMSPFTFIGNLIDSIFGTNIVDSLKGVTDMFSGLFSLVIDKGLKVVVGYFTILWDMTKQLGNLLFEFMITPFKTLYDIGQAIYMMFTGDFMGGLELLGTAILDYILAPFNLIWGIVETVLDGLGSIGEAASAVGKFFGFGGDEEEKAKGKVEEKKGVVTAMATGGEVSAKGGVAVVGEQGPELVKLPGSAEVVPNHEINNQIGTGGSSGDQSKIVELLTQIYNEVQKPAVIKLGNKFVGEIDSSMGIRRNLRDNFDNQYGSTT